MDLGPEQSGRDGAALETGLGIRWVSAGGTEKGEDTRWHVLTAAMRCIAEAGYVGTSMRDIAAEAGQNVATIYYYFPSKTLLVVTLIEHCARAMVGALRGAGNTLAGSREEGTRRLLASLVALAREPSLEARVLMDLATQVSHDPALRRAVACAFDGIAADIVARLGAEKGDPAARVLSDFLLSALHGLVVLDGCFDRPWSGTDELRARAFEAMALAVQGAMGNAGAAGP